MTRSTVTKLTKTLDEPEREFRRLRRADLRSHQNDSLAISGRNLFDDEASSSNNTEPKPPTPPKTLHEHSRPISFGDDEPIKSAWIRFQDLINQVPHHGIQKWILVQIFHDNISQDDRRKLDQFTQFHFHSLNEEEGWIRIEEYVQYQDDLWDDMSPPLNISSILETMQPKFKGRLKRACHQISYLETPTREVRLKNPYLICDYCGGSHEADECKQLSQAEHVCLSGGDIYNDPSLMREKEGLEGAKPNITQEPAPRPSILYPPSKTSNLPFPSRLKKQKKDDEDERLLSIFKQIYINLPFLKEMIHMPKGAKVLKDLLSHKEKLKKPASSIKLRASINLMPHSFFQRLGISKLKPTKMSIQLADRSIKYSIRVCENLLVKVGKFIFPVDFVILEMDKDELVPIILGRPFLATARAVIDVHKGKLSLRVGNKTITFNIGKSMKSKHFRDDYQYCADHTAKLIHEQWIDTVNHEGKWIEEDEEEDSNKALAVSFYPRTEPVEPLKWKAPDNRLKPSSVEPPKLEFK
ncbi:DNA-directed DNA polymerase [Tanacetum coccineum]